jgi:hypothetical protein
MQRRIATLSNRTPLRQVKRSGKDTTYDYEEFTRDIVQLRKYANMRIADVAKDTQIFEVFTRVKKLLSIASDSPVVNDLMKIIDTHFATLVTPIPYTIGALFRGWNIPTNMDGTEFESCLAVRIGSIQNVGVKSKCTYVSVYADWNGSTFTFTNDVVDRSTDTRPLDKVVINVPFTNVSSFPGFSIEEKKELKNNEINEVCIIGFKVGANNYYHLTNSTFIPIDSIKTRHPKPLTTEQIKTKLKPKSKQQQDGYGSYAWVFFIIIILVILILGFAFWK